MVILVKNDPTICAKSPAKSPVCSQLTMSALPVDVSPASSSSSSSPRSLTHHHPRVSSSNSRTSDSPRRPLRTLPRAQPLHGLLLALLHILRRLHQYHFHVARVAHVRVDATVSAVCSSPLFWGLVDLDVLDDEVGGVETFGVGVGFGVLEEVQEEGGGFDGVAGAGYAECFAYSGEKVSGLEVGVEVENVVLSSSSELLSGDEDDPSKSPKSSFPRPSLERGRRLWKSLFKRTLRISPRTTSIPPHRNSLLELLHILKIFDSTLHFPAVNSLCGLAGVLEADTKVAASGAGGFCRGEFIEGGGVADLAEKVSSRAIASLICEMFE